MSIDLPADLSNADWSALDTALLADHPAADPSWLDGYWAGLALQPEPPDTGAATQAILGVDAMAPEVNTLAQRRVQFLRATWRAQGWWDPFVRAPQDGETLLPDPSAEPVAAQPPVSPASLSEALGPWVAGLEQALHDFPLEALDGGQADPAGMMVLARLYRHLPAHGPQEQALVDLLNQAHPLDSLEDAVDELSACVAELWDLSAPRPAASRQAPQGG